MGFKMATTEQLERNQTYILKVSQDYLSGKQEFYGAFILDGNEVFADNVSEKPKTLRNLIASSSSFKPKHYSNVTFRKGNFPDFSLHNDGSLISSFSELNPQEQKIVVEELQRIIRGEEGR